MATPNELNSNDKPEALSKRRGKDQEPDPSPLQLLDELLSGRRTVHQFETRAVPRELLREALDLARFAPNHKHSEPWRFHLLGRRAIERVASLNARLVRKQKGEDVARKKLERWLALPGMLAITSCTSGDDIVRHQEDYAACCCAAHNLSLALWARGVGLKWTTGPFTRTQEFHDILGLDMTERYAIGLFFYGYPSEVPDVRRKPLDDLLELLD